MGVWVMVGRRRLICDGILGHRRLLVCVNLGRGLTRMKDDGPCSDFSILALYLKKKMQIFNWKCKY